MPIFQRVNLKNSSRDIILKFEDHALFETWLDLAIATAPREETSHFDNRETAN